MMNIEVANNKHITGRKKKWRNLGQKADRVQTNGINNVAIAKSWEEIISFWVCKNSQEKKKNRLIKEMPKKDICAKRSILLFQEA